MANQATMFILYKRQSESENWQEIWRFSESEEDKAKFQFDFLRVNGYGLYALEKFSGIKSDESFDFDWDDLTAGKEATNG